jgi:molybdate transport system substrate-binding protein
MAGGHSFLRAGLAACGLIAWGNFAMTGAAAGTLEVFHADSLAGPLREIKAAFEAKNPGVRINLTPGVSKGLAERILKGETCDVYASSSPAVLDDDLMPKKVAGTDRPGASWYVVFSANEMVLIVEKGNPRGIKKLADLAGPEVKFVRVTGEKDLGTGRTIEFLKRAAALEGEPELAPKLIAKSPEDAAKPNSVPDTVRAVREGRANAGVVYYSAAVAARGEVEIIRFPAQVNMSEAIRNAASVPGTAKNPKEATEFVRFLLTPEAQAILQTTGQPPVVPPIRKGNVPAEIGG